MKPGQRFVVAQRLCFAAIASLGFYAVGLGGELGLAGGLAALIGVGASLWHGRPRLSDRVWLNVQLAFLLWLGVRWVSGTHVLSIFAQLLVFVQVHRLLTRRRTRDDLYSAFIAFGQILLASVLTVDVMFFVVFMAFVFFVIQGLLLSRMAVAAEASWEAVQGTAVDTPPTRAYASLDGLVRLRLVAATTALAALIQVGTLALFFVLPRAQAAMLSGLASPLSVSGFSDKVRLGSVGAMQLSREPVMRVRARQGDGEQFQGVGSLYFRGLALDRFDGRGWQLSDDRRTLLSARGGSEGAPPPRELPWQVELEITLEPLDSKVIFHVADAAGIYGDFPTMEAVSTDGFYVPGPARRRTYRVFAELSPPDPAVLRSLDPAAAPGALAARYTQLPPDLSPRIEELAREWSAGARTPLDRLLLLQEQLSGFLYSLDQAPSAYDDPLLAFLDDVQEGHCEYFASGLAVMARTLGIPSRVVNGFAGAEWNPVGEYWVVRQLHAHSWVEVWFPGEGWVLFDPTPARAGGLDAAAQLTLAARVRAWMDVGSVTWASVMLDYGLDTQMEGLRRGIESLGDLGTGRIEIGDVLAGRERSGEEGPPRGSLALLGVGALLVVLAVAIALRPRGGSKGERAAARLAERLGQRLPRPPDAPSPTLLELVEEAARLDPERFGRGPEVVARYYASRFGGGELSSADLTALGRLGRAARRLPRAAEASRSGE